MAELSPEEIAAMPSMTDLDWEVLLADQERIAAQLEAQQSAKESALIKLAKLGLTEEEAKAVIGL